MTPRITHTQHNSALPNAGHRYAECRVLFIVMLSVNMMNVILLTVVWLNVVMLSVVAPFSILHKHQTRMKVTNPLAYCTAK
jgi:hypothetical protein